MKPSGKTQTFHVDLLVRRLSLLCGALTLALVVALSLFFVAGGLYGIAKTGFPTFFLGEEQSGGYAGLLPLLLSAVYAVGAAILISAPLGILTAVFFRYSPISRFIRPVRWFFRFMASLPGVVYAMAAAGTLMPFLAGRFGVAQGKCLLAAILLLAAKMVPDVVLDAMHLVGRSHSQTEVAALCLGADSMEALFQVGLPGKWRGLCAAIFHAAGKAVGETLAVILVAGSVFNWPMLLQQDVLPSTSVFFTLDQGRVYLALGLSLVLFLGVLGLQAYRWVLLRNESAKPGARRKGGGPV